MLCVCLICVLQISLKLSNNYKQRKNKHTKSQTHPNIAKPNQQITNNTNTTQIQKTQKQSRNLTNKHQQSNTHTKHRKTTRNRKQTITSQQNWLSEGSAHCFPTRPNWLRGAGRR